MNTFLIVFVAVCFLVYQMGRYEAKHGKVDK